MWFLFFLLSNGKSSKFNTDLHIYLAWLNRPIGYCEGPRLLCNGDFSFVHVCVKFSLILCFSTSFPTGAHSCNCVIKNVNWFPREVCNFIIPFFLKSMPLCWCCFYIPLIHRLTFCLWMIFREINNDPQYVFPHRECSYLQREIFAATPEESLREVQGFRTEF